MQPVNGYSGSLAQDQFERVAELAGVAELEPAAIGDVVDPPALRRVGQQQHVRPVHGRTAFLGMGERDGAPRRRSCDAAGTGTPTRRAFKHRAEEIALDQRWRAFHLGRETQLRRGSIGQHLVQLW